MSDNRGSNGLSEKDAEAIYDVLIEHAGASKRSDSKLQFVYAQTDRFCSEYRFQGSLGFGGKFWRNNDRWYISAYREDITPKVQEAIDQTNAALALLMAGKDT